MPRHGRLAIAGLPLHIVQRGHNRERCFHADGDYRQYLSILAEHAARCDCAIHAFVLMTNHVHLLLTPRSRDAASHLMKAVGQAYAQYGNWRLEKSGPFWEGRFFSSIVQSSRYLFSCQRYIELNPVRAGMVDAPHEYPWSSFHANAGGSHCPFLSPHPEYLALATSNEQRQQAYRALFDCELEPSVVDRIRMASRGGFAVGEDDFHLALSRQLGVTTQARPRGRPPRERLEK
jgi:putative transposase